MDIGNEDLGGGNPRPEIETVVYRLHWIVYAGPVLLFLILCAGGIAIAVSYQMPLFWLMPLVASVYLVIACWRRWAYSVRVDGRGVWVASGIMPWTKGINGANWRDIRIAQYRTGFVSWLLKAYDVTVEHRYTQSDELVMRNIKNGNRLVAQVNGMVEKLNLY